MNRRRRLVVRRRAPSRCLNEFDERLESSSSFSRPAASIQRPLTITSTFSPSTRRPVDPSLPSPCASDVSRTDSNEGAPSLVSDSGSTFSISPGPTLLTPNVELPPLTVMGPDSRRPSLPVIHLASNAFVSEADPHDQACSTRFHNDTKYYSSSGFHMPLYRPQQPLAHDQRHIYHDSRSQQLLTALPTPLHLPPLQSFAQPSDNQPEKKVERDSRMHLSSLLG